MLYMVYVLCVEMQRKSKRRAWCCFFSRCAAGWLVALRRACASCTLKCPVVFVHDASAHCVTEILMNGGQIIDSLRLNAAWLYFFTWMISATTMKMLTLKQILIWITMNWICLKSDALMFHPFSINCVLNSFKYFVNEVIWKCSWNRRSISNMPLTVESQQI